MRLSQRYILITALLIILINTVTNTYCQIPAGIGSIDLSTIKVDQLTDDQIKQMVKKAETSGMTQDQLAAAAIAKGMPTMEVQKLKDRIAKLNLNKNLQKSTGEKISDRTRQLNLPEQETQTGLPLDQIDPITEMFGIIAKEKTGINELEKKIFGFTLFNTKALTFEPSLNIPTPINYQIGPGDEVLIDVWGASQQSYKLTVSPDGFILIDNVGPININGLTIDKASQKITGRLSSIYAGLLGSNPNTFAQVSLGNLRSIKVTLVGEVKSPGSYTLPSLATVFNALYASGGPSVNGSFRTISVYRENKLVSTLDVYDFLVKGDQKANIRLQDQDIIMIKPFKTRVEINGEVKIPAYFEMQDNETLSDLIKFAGGFTDKAYSYRLKIVRNTEREHRIIDVPQLEFATTKLNNGDVINVEPILNRFENRVEIQGAVFRPGQYELDSSQTLTQLLNKAEGLRGDAFMTRAIIYRMQDDFTIEAIPVDLNALMKGNFDVTLKKEDMVKIFSIFDLQEEYTIQIDGEILKPGGYPFIKNMTLEDVIAMSGGFKESASQARIEVARRIKNSDINSASAKIADVYLFDVTKELSLSDSASKFVIEPFDRIFVRRSPGYEIQTIAKIYGEVIYPGAYSIINKDERISDLIKRAGNLTNEAYPKGAKLTRKLNVNEKERRKILRAIESESNDSLKFQVSHETEQSIGINLEEIIKNPHSKYDLILQDGDILEIPKEIQTVRLSGAFLYPITVRYDKGQSLSKYAAMAGGFSEDAQPGKAFVVYANGSVDKTSNFLWFKFYPKVEPGAEIIVPKKVESRKMTPQEALGLSTAMTSLALIIVTVISKI